MSEDRNASDCHPMLLPTRCYHPLYKFFIKPLIIVSFPVVLVFRICAVIPILALSALCDFLLNLGTDQSTPLPRVRRALFRAQKWLLYRAALLILGWLLVVEGAPHDGVKTVVANHCSMLDILAFTAAGLDSCIAKAAIAKNPFFAPTLRVTRSILARSGKGTEQVTERFYQDGWPPIGAFPTGTTTYYGVLPKMRTGMFLARPSVQIASIKYYSLENPFYITGALRHLFGVCAGVFGVIKITYYEETYRAAPDESHVDYAARIAGLLAEKSHAVQTPYTYKDMLWFDRCGGFTEKDLSEEYKRDHLWRGDIREWSKMCLAHKKDPLYAWTKADLNV